MEYRKEILAHLTNIVQQVLTAENNIGSYNLEKLKLGLISERDYCELVAQELIRVAENDSQDGKDRISEIQK